MSSSDQMSSAPAAASTSSAVDSLTCQWGDCRHRCTSAETLYEHVCEKHVGRKSTNNLSLTCQWGACHTTTVKRDHITSHIRVHVPLKPHKCDFCGKAFKRPQDLKKHVKTHADESVLLNSPEPASSNRMPVSGGYQQQGGNKHNGYMADNNYSHHANYNHYQPTSGHGYYGNAGGVSHNSNYGPVYYQVPQTAGLAGGDRRGHDALNRFFGDIKRKDIDPNQYYDVNDRLGAVQSLSLPMFGGMQGIESMGDMNAGGPAVAYSSGPLPHQHYDMAFSELKTRNDLMSIDQFLQQLQETVYEHPEHTMNQLGQQPIQRSQQPLRQADLSTLQDSAPSVMHTPSSFSTSSYGNADTPPALTPTSYTSMTHSPRSVHSSVHQSVSPAPRPVQGNLYPSLPSLSSLNDMAPAFTPTSGAPSSGLSNAFDDFETRRRFSGGYLQRAQPRTSPPRSAGSNSPNADRDAALATGVKKIDLSTAKPAKPAEVGEFQRRGSSGQKSDSSSDDREAAWVQNMRVIEKLREFIQTRLKNKEYDEAASRPTSEERKVDRDGDSEMSEGKKEAKSLYPMLRPVET